MELLATLNWLAITYAGALLLIGFFIAKQVSSLAERAMSKRYSRHRAVLVRRLLFYSLFLLFAFSALQQLGFQLTVLLGAAGVFTVALSFASQTAASNLVSGIFLIFESPFKVGDRIKIKDVVGVVDSMDLLSTKIQTSDHIRIRIPNETIVKSEIANMSYFATRRVDVTIEVSYEQNLAEAKKALLDLVKQHENTLDQPEPQIIINQVGSGTIELQLMVWVPTALASKMQDQLKEQMISLKKNWSAASANKG